MSATTQADTELRQGLDRLRRALRTEPEGSAPADEGAWFRLVDEVAEDASHGTLLEEIGTSFAKAFVDPYLHASDLPGVVREVSGLLAIHHRGRIAIESATAAEAVVLLGTLRSDGEAQLPTPFERAVITEAVRARFPGAEVRSEGCEHAIGCERLRITVKAR